MTAKQAFEALERAAATTTFAGVKNIKMRRPWYIVREALGGKRAVIRPCYYSGRSRFTTLLDYTDLTMKLLDAAGIEYAFENDAPRGSHTRNKITMTNVEF